MATYARYITDETTLERLTLVGPWQLGATVMGELHEEGFRIVRSGPYTDSRMFPKVDDSRFQFVVEREARAAQDINEDVTR